MKVIGICASPRRKKSRTLALTGCILDGARFSGAKTELFNIGELEIGFCDACDACHKTGKCRKDDDFSHVYGEMKDADGIVLGSPVYIDNVSGQMKAFMDRMADAIHFQALDGKYGCSVCTTWSSGGDEVVGYLDRFLHYLGVVTIDGLAVSLGDRVDVPEESFALARKRGEILADAITERKHFPEQEEWILENREFFGTIVTSLKDYRPDEYESWVKRGWIR